MHREGRRSASILIALNILRSSAQTLASEDWNPPVHFRHVLNIEQPQEEKDARIRNLTCTMNSMATVSSWAFDCTDASFSLYSKKIYAEEDAAVPGAYDVCSYMKSTYFALRAVEDAEKEETCPADGCDGARRKVIWNSSIPVVPDHIRKEAGRKVFSNSTTSVLIRHIDHVHAGMNAEDMRRRLLFFIDNMVVVFCLNTLQMQYSTNPFFPKLVSAFIDEPRRFIYEDIFGPRWKVVEELLRRRSGMGPLVVAELGVEKGSTMRYLLSRTDLDIAEYYGIDPLASDKPDLNRTLQFYYRNLSASLPQNARIIRKKTTDAFAHFPDHFFDLIFIDADHDFQPALDDMRDWARKVKPGGIIAGHDFTPLQITVMIAVCFAWQLPIHIATDSVWWVDLSEPVVPY